MDKKNVTSRAYHAVYDRNKAGKSPGELQKLKKKASEAGAKAWEEYLMQHRSCYYMYNDIHIYTHILRLASQNLVRILTKF